MFSSIVICGGMYRSGSTWSFNVCRELVQLHGRRSGQPVASCFFNLLELDYFLNARAASLPGPVVIKAHLLGEVTWQAIDAGRARAVVTIRDPRDCVASDMKFMSLDFEKSTERMVESLKNFPPSHHSPHAFFVAYEQMMADRLGMIGRIAAHLGIEVNEQEILETDGRTNMDASKKICRSLHEGPAKEIDPDTGHPIDSATQLHATHIDSGKVGRWKEELSVEQVKIQNRTFEKWMSLLGYSL